MSRKIKVILLVLVGLVTLALTLRYLHGKDLGVLAPKGVMAARERSLMITATLLMLIVVIPVFILTFTIAWRYRESNTAAKYTPEADHSGLYESIWWAVPTLIILVLASVAWKSAHALDPFKPLNSSTTPIDIQVVALPWKWLFIYPKQQVASVNFVEFPAATPINFEITADAPMNSFWIPRLSGQVYAMAGMSTALHVEADAPGSFAGSSANLSGRGFAGMRFTARAAKPADFTNWVQTLRGQDRPLSVASYQKLATPSENNPVAYYSKAEDGLYERIIMKYMSPDAVGMSHDSH